MLFRSTVTDTSPVFVQWSIESVQGPSVVPLLVPHASSECGGSAVVVWEEDEASALETNGAGMLHYQVCLSEAVSEQTDGCSAGERGGAMIDWCALMSVSVSVFVSVYVSVFAVVSVCVSCVDVDVCVCACVCVGVCMICF